MMGRVRGLLIWFFLLSSVSCGPELSTRDKETEQITETFAQRKAEYDSVNGEFIGSMKTIEGNGVFRVEVLIRTFVELIPAPNRVDYIPVPTLIGNLRGLESDNVAWPITRGYFDSAEGTLKLSGSNESVFFFIDLKRVGQKFVGTVTRGRYFSSIELSPKVKN